MTREEMNWNQEFSKMDEELGSPEIEDIEDQGMDKDEKIPFLFDSLCDCEDNYDEEDIEEKDLFDLFGDC